MAPRLGGAVAGQQIPDLPPGVAPPSGPRALRVRLGSGPTAPVKLASGCDRRCTFCAIPAFRGSFLSRRPEDVLADTQWLASQGVREIFLVSENTTSYGKDLGDLTLLESLLSDLVAVPGVARLRLSYLQPAELRPALLAAIATTPGVAPYFDLSFQHASAPVLRRMRRHGDAGRFLDLLAEIRRHEPRAGVRSNVIVGFPGETEADLRVLEDFLAAARLDAVGVFGYSDEDGTAAARLPGKVHPDEVAQRVERVTSLGEDLMEQRGDERVGEPVDVLVESLAAGGRGAGRAAHQGPEVDGDVELSGLPRSVRVGDVVAATVRSGGPAGCLAAVATRADGAHPLR
jgi:MiaB/RimO family radical SAM methylthiotransferase